MGHINFGCYQLQMSNEAFINVTIVSFMREAVERYLTVTVSVLVRMFEVMIYDAVKSAYDG